MSQETRNTTEDDPQHVSVPLVNMLVRMGPAGEKIAEEVIAVSTSDGQHMPGKPEAKSKDD